jgi:hypothetical protein
MSSRAWPRPTPDFNSRTVRNVRAEARGKISRAFVDGEPAGNLTRENIVDNITLYWLTGHGRLGGPVVLGDRTGPSRSPCGRPGSSGGLGSGRLHDVPQRDLRCPAQLGRDGLPQPHVLQRGREGRPLRRLGGAAALRDRGAGGISVTALISARGRRARRLTPRTGSRQRASCLTEAGAGLPRSPTSMEHEAPSLDASLPRVRKERLVLTLPGRSATNEVPDPRRDVAGARGRCRYRDHRALGTRCVCH